MKYSDYLHESEVQHKTISYDLLTPKPVKGKIVPENKNCPSKALSLCTIHLRKSYGSSKSCSTSSSVFILFQLLILRQPISSATTICLGLIAVIIGLAIFMEGLKVRLMPFGNIIGDTLPKKVSMFVVLIIIAMLGVGVTYAEPAIALKAFELR